MKIFFTCLILFFVTNLVNAQAATFQSKATGGWGSASTWTITAGSDVDGIPDGDDKVIVSHTVTLLGGGQNSFSKGFTITPTGVVEGNNGKIVLKGNFTNNGQVIQNVNVVAQNTCTFSSVSTFTNSGEIRVTGGTLTIAAGTVLKKRGNINLQISGTKMVNYGSITLNTGSPIGRVSGASNTLFTNKPGAFLKVAADFAGNATFDFSAPTNTVSYFGTCTNIINVPYANLEIVVSGSKSLTGDLTVAENFIFSGVTNTLVMNGFNLNLSGNFIHNSGTIDFESSGAKILFNNASGATQIVSGAAITRFFDVEINNPGGSVSFVTKKRVINDLIMTSGNCNSNTDKLILTSDVNATASIPAISNTTTISFSGSMVVEKFIDAMSLYYLQMFYDLSSPTQNSVVMDWDNEIYISGVGTSDNTPGPAGVDGITPAGFQSMFTYAETTNAFTAITSTSTPLVPAKGYELILSDDEGVSQWNAKTIDSRGIPNYGDITVTGLTYTGTKGKGWYLTGNPYASAIDFNTVTKQNVSNNVFFVDQGNYSNWFTAFGNRIIPAHQGFYLQANSGGFGAKSVTYKESDKITDHTTIYNKNKPVYDVKLVLSSALTPYFHENHLIFDEQAQVGYEEELDAFYRKFPAAIAPAMYMKDAAADVGMITNYMNTKADEVTIPLEIFTPKTGVYYIDAVVLNTETYKNIWIENSKTGDKYEVGNPAAVDGKEMEINHNFVLRMSKAVKPQIIEKEDNNVLVFATENNLNLKSIGQDQILTEVKMYDMTGKLVLSQSNIAITTTNALQIDIANLKPGIYIVNTVNAQMKTKNSKIVK